MSLIVYLDYCACQLLTFHIYVFFDLDSKLVRFSDLKLSCYVYIVYMGSGHVRLLIYMCVFVWPNVEARVLVSLVLEYHCLMST